MIKLGFYRGTRSWSGGRWAQSDLHYLHMLTLYHWKFGFIFVSAVLRQWSFGRISAFHLYNVDLVAASLSSLVGVILTAESCFFWHEGDMWCSRFILFNTWLCFDKLPLPWNTPVVISSLYVHNSITVWSSPVGKTNFVRGLNPTVVVRVSRIASENVSVEFSKIIHSQRFNLYYK